MTGQEFRQRLIKVGCVYGETSSAVINFHLAASLLGYSSETLIAVANNNKPASERLLKRLTEFEAGRLQSKKERVL